MKEQPTRLPFYLSLAAIVLFILLFASTAGRPLQLDNVDFPAAAERTAFTGLPFYYRGEEIPTMQGLYHPPLYIYTLAAWMRVFGTGEVQVRLLGMTCALLQGLVVLLILRTLFGPATVRRWAPYFWAIFLLNPFTLETATIADIDSTIYGPLLCGAILAVLRISWRDGEWRTDEVREREYALVAFVLCLCLWAKLTTVLLTYPFVFLLLIARVGMKRAAIATAVIAAWSIVPFAATYAFYGVLTGADVRETLAFTWMSFAQRGSSGAPGSLAHLGDYLRNFAFMGPFMLAWTGLLPWVAAVAGLALSAAAALRKRDRRMQHYALVLGLALLSTVYYCMKVRTFGFAPFKYALVYWGILLTVPLFVLGGPDSPPGARRRSRVAVLTLPAFAAGAIWASRALQDHLMLDGFEGPYTLAVYIPALLFLAGLVLKRRFTWASSLTVATLALFCGIQLGSGVYQESVSYSTTYDYGQSGFIETADFLESNTTPDDILVSMKDIGYRAKRRYYETYGALYEYPGCRQALERFITKGRAAYAVFTEGRGQDQLWVNPSFREWLLARCTLVRSFGNYRVYQLTETVRKRRAAECAQGAK